MNEALLKKFAKPLLLIATLIWGTTFFIMKDTLDTVSAQFLLAFRFTFAAAVLALVFFRRWKEIDRSYLLRGILMGLFQYIAYTVQTEGLRGTTPGKNAFFSTTYCILVPFFYWVLTRRRPDRYNTLAALLCIVGIGFISWDGGLSLTYGDVLTLISGIFYALHVIAATKFSQGRDVFLLTVLQFSTTAVCCWAGVLFTDGFPVGGLPARAWLVLVYLAFAATALALLFQNIGQKYTSPSSSAVLLSLEAPFGVFFSVLAGAESPTGLMYLGFVLIFLAILCSETKFAFLRTKKRLS